MVGESAPKENQIHSMYVLGLYKFYFDYRDSF